MDQPEADAIPAAQGWQESPPCPDGDFTVFISTGSGTRPKVALWAVTLELLRILVILPEKKLTSNDPDKANLDPTASHMSSTSI